MEAIAHGLDSALHTMQLWRCVANCTVYQAANHLPHAIVGTMKRLSDRLNETKRTKPRNVYGTNVQRENV